MADPITLSFIATSCALAIVGNRADAAAVTSVKRLAASLRKPVTPANHDVLAATHRAFVQSIQLMAEACSRSGGDERSHFVARRLSGVVKSPDLTTFKAGTVAIPKKELDASVRALFEGASPDPALNAADLVIASLERAMGEPLTDEFRSLFRDGSDLHRSWPQAFELFFAEQVKTNEKVFRALGFERLNEILAFAEAHAGEIERLCDALARGFAESIERDARMERKIDALLAEIREQRGDQIEKAGIDPYAIVRIARKVSENVADPSQALAEIEAAIDDLLALRRDAARGSNLDALVESALKRIDEHAAAGQFDAAAQEAERAFAQWEEREADRRERERAIGIRFAEENIRTNRLRRDPEAVALWVLRKAQLERPEVGDEIVAARPVVWELIKNGRDNGVNLDLEIAVSIAQRVQQAPMASEQLASLFLWKGVALRILGERSEGTAVLNQSVAAFKAALGIYTREQTPIDWAGTQNNLGNSLVPLGKREREVFALEQAVAAFRAALEVFTRDRLPLEWAMVQNNLGNALVNLGERQEEASTLGESVTAYRAALEVYTRDDLPLDWAMTQNNLGTALGVLGEQQDELAALHEAVVAFRAALEVYTRDRLPLDWATTQNNLGTALCALGLRQEGTAAIDEAVAAYHLALEVRTRDQSPFQWALTQENVGYVLHVKAEKLGDCTAAREAVMAFEASLEVFAHPDLAWNRHKAERGLAKALASRDRLCDE